MGALDYPANQPLLINPLILRKSHDGEK